MSSRPDLRLDWCAAEAARYAVEKWHYSRTIPAGKSVRVGCWEDGRFIGVVMFGMGAGKATCGLRYGLRETLEVCELTRVALSRHRSPTSRIVAIALRMLKAQCPGIRLVISFADPAEGHHGGLYQAGGWIYTGDSGEAKLWLHRGEWKHTRTLSSGHFGHGRVVTGYRDLPFRVVPGKHRYLMPLDDQMRARIAPLALPYPKRVRPSGAEESPSSAGGAAPTRTLQPSDDCPEGGADARR